MVRGREVGAGDDCDVGFREEEFREDLGRGDGLARQRQAVGAGDVGEEEERPGRVAVGIDAGDVREPVVTPSRRPGPGVFHRDERSGLSTGHACPGSRRRRARRPVRPRTSAQSAVALTRAQARITP